MPEALAQRMRCGQRFELGDRLAVAPARELRLYPRRERGEPLLLEPRTLGGGQTGRRPDRPAPTPLQAGRLIEKTNRPSGWVRFGRAPLVQLLQVRVMMPVQVPGPAQHGISPSTQIPCATTQSDSTQSLLPPVVG